MSTDIQKFNEEVSKELANKETFATLVATTFKGLKEHNIRPAIIEGLIRGFSFNDFLEKNVYAIPFKEGYSLVTSIHYARKIGMRSGIIGSKEPLFEMDGSKIVACSVTVKRKVQGEIGEFTEKVYFSEYSSGRNLWESKPRTMIAKVAEMHALRKACPEEMSQLYTQEEVEQKPAKVEPADLAPAEAKLRATKDMAELLTAWSSLTGFEKKNLEAVKNEVKIKLTPAALATSHA
jgi:hypothetical protein